MPPPLNFRPDLSQPQPGSDAALALGWTYPAARQACDDHARGSFVLSWQLWLDMDGVPSIRAARELRIASSVELPFEVLGDKRAQRAPARFELEAARSLWQTHGARLLDSTLSDVIGEGLSVWQHPTAINPITKRREVLTIERWPLSQVRYTATPFPDAWNPGKWIEGYYAIQFGTGDSVGATLYDPSRGKVDVRFVQLPRPGQTDGHWTVFGRGDRPHLRGCIRSVDVSFIAGAMAPRARGNVLKTLGRQSPVGELPGTTPVDSPEGKALEKVVAGLGVTTAGAVIPGGAKIGSFSLTTQTASLFTDDALLTLQNVELAILGRIQTRGAQYVAKDGQEEVIPEKLVRADVGVIEGGFSALCQILAEHNVANPGRIYLTGHLPDVEQEARRAAELEQHKGEADKLAKFHNAVAVERANGFDFPATPDGQARLDFIAAKCGVVAPQIPPGGLPPPLVRVPPPTTQIVTAATVPAERQEAPPAPGVP